MMPRARQLLVALALPVLVVSAACGDTGGGTDGGGGKTGQSGVGGGGGGSGGLCQEGKVGLSGDADGVGIELSAPKTGHALVQTTDPATYSIQFDGGNLDFTWTGGPIAVGQSTPTTGTLRVNGTTYCFASGTITLGGDGGFDEFQVGDLSESADNGVTCPGTAVAGSLEGCADAD
jgi:hypothetical protein